MISTPRCGSMVDVWRNFHADQVYRADSLGVLRTGASWLTLMSVGWLLARWRKLKPRSLLDNAPLLDLLQATGAAGQAARNSWPRASCTRWPSRRRATARGEHVTFFDGARQHRCLDPFAALRRARAHHLPASAGVVGDSVRVSRPRRCRSTVATSISATARCASRHRWPPPSTWEPSASWWSAPGACTNPRSIGADAPPNKYPTLAQIAGHTLSNIFLDALAVDVERVRRINHTIGLVPARGARGQRACARSNCW